MAYVYIGVPSRTKGYWGMFQALFNAIMYAAQTGINCLMVPKVGCSLICRARQDMTADFLNHPIATHFMQVDDDVAIPADTIHKLVSADKNVIGGMYALKDASGNIPVRPLDNKPLNVKDFKPGELKEVKYLATGCLMQKREAVQAAWDHYDDLKYMTLNGQERRGLYMPFIHDLEYLSEDYAYFQRLLNMGEKVWLHTDIRCVHHGLSSYGIAS